MKALHTVSATLVGCRACQVTILRRKYDSSTSFRNKLAEMALRASKKSIDVQCVTMPGPLDALGTARWSVDQYMPSWRLYRIEK
jgi:hypothetical protein